MPATNAYCHTNPMTFTCYINTFMILQNQMRILKKRCMRWFSTEHADDFICEFTLQKSSHSYYKQKKPNNQSYIFYYFLINIFYRQWLQVSYPPPSNPWRLLSQYVCQNLVCILKVNRWKFFPTQVHANTCCWYTYTKSVTHDSHYLSAEMLQLLFQCIVKCLPGIEGWERSLSGNVHCDGKPH